MIRNGDVAETHAPAMGSNRSAYLWWVVWIMWVPFFIPSVVDFLHTHPPLAQILASFVGVALFFILYFWTTWRCAQNLASASPRVTPTAAALWTPIAVMLALAVALTLMNGPQWGALFIYASTSSAGWLPLRQAVGTIAGMVVFTAVGLSLQAGVAAVLSPVGFIIVPGFVVIAVVRSVNTSQQLRVAQEDMARFAAVTEERLRIARDLHDLLGHHLSLIALKSELARRLLGEAPERAAVEIGDIEQSARTALQEVREAVAGYRQPTLVSELRAAQEILAAAGIAYQYDGETAPAIGFPAATEAVLSWAVREGVTNVIRHSRAQHCRVRVAQDGDWARVEVCDDGRGAEATQPMPFTVEAREQRRPGSGLAGLAERVAAQGGHFEVGARLDGGFRLAVSVPITPRAPTASAVGTSAASATFQPPSAVSVESNPQPVASAGDEAHERGALR
jgi:two-component system, NarL family, sensor histidine kinase DesK